MVMRSPTMHRVARRLHCLDIVRRTAAASRRGATPQYLEPSRSRSGAVRLLSTARSRDVVEAARAAIDARRPQPDKSDDSRTLYRPSVPQTFLDRLAMHWRGHPIDLNHTHDMWARKESGMEKFKRVVTMHRSETARRILYPELVACFGISCAVVAHNMWVAWENEHNLFPVEQAGFNLMLHHDMAALPVEPFTLSAFALGLILAFRTNSAHGRYVEARMLLGQMVNLTRELSSRFAARQPKDAAASTLQHRAIALVATFAHTMKYHLTVDGCNQNITFIGDVATMKRGCDEREVSQALRQELVVIWNGDVPYIDALLRCDVANRPLHVLHELGRLVVENDLGLDSIATAQLNDRLNDLMSVLGGCERILRTPIYTPYTRHLSRFLFVWCSTLPLALYPLVGPLGTVPTSTVLSFFFLGIEDIGVRIEQPFDVLPLWQYVDAIDASCNQILQHESEH